MTYWVRSLLPIEKKSAGIRSTATAAAGVSTMMPSGGILASAFSASSSARQAAKSSRVSWSSPAVATIGSITLSGPKTAARSSART